MISINDFEFEWCGYSHYKVTYTSPKTWNKWTRVTNDMRLIDSTKNEGAFAKKKDLNNLKRFVKTTHHE
jgi:hypothetical protein